MNTAQSLLSEVTMNGGHLCRRKDGTYYLDEQELPTDLLHNLSSAISFFADDIMVGSANVNNFLNFYMKRFFSNTGYWTVPPAHQEAVAELEAILGDPVEEPVEPPHPVRPNPNPARAYDNVEQPYFSTPVPKKGDSA
ncbi:unnamed protein product [Cylicostephanus goldi]|uniref:Uncharacterized protein n=1 Tax=Cylicostephanus goldi TaxID=71465 RepID=A0A3P7NZ74_CYLGO|nr:unnamed protein product [Cylicostephanus goldi]